MGFINSKLSRLFYSLGLKIAKYPKYFITVMIILSLSLATGLLQLNYIADVEYLYTQSSGPSKFERDQVEKYFPSNNSGRFDPSRAEKIGRFARLIITARDGGSLLHLTVWEEIIELNNLIQDARVKWKQEWYNYSRLCARWHEDCFENDALDLGTIIEQIELGSLRLSYPVMFHPLNFKVLVLPQYFGGISLNKDGNRVTGIKAILLNYILADDNKEDDMRGIKWETEILRKLEQADLHWRQIKINRLTFQTFPTETEANLFSVVPHFTVTVFFMFVFVILATMMNDFVKSKPWLGIMGIFSAGLGTIAGGGLLCYIGVPFFGILMAVPFLMLGIGLDDTFVIIGSWRRTSPTDTVPKRLAQCYSEAAVSITITTLTDMLSFLVGAFTSIPSLQIFSLYAGTCVFCIYIWQIFFFGGAMALSGYHEAENRHSIFWWKVAIPKSQAENMSPRPRFYWTGGIDPKDPNNTLDNPENSVMVFFRDHFSKFICKTPVKVIVLLLSVAYIVSASWGLSNIEEGLKQEHLARYDSYMTKFIQADNKYFKVYPYRIQVIITTPLDYSKQETKEGVKKLLQQFYDTDYITEQFSENWLQDFTRFVENYKEFLELDVSSEQDFINTLRNHYLNDRMPISEDIKFNANKTKIIATRYIIQSKNVFNSVADRDLLIQLRKVADQQSDFNVTIYHPWFHFSDQHIIIRELTIKLVTSAAVIVLLVAIIFIPNLVSTMCVLFTIASIELGVLGFMSLWSVNLDLISVLCLVMCIGFSVDFSAHISYAYITAEGETTEDRIKVALYSLGLPIVQAGISTVIGVGALVIAPSYNFQIFFKIVILIIIFAIWHALFLLPVVLSIFRPERGLSASPKSKIYTVYPTLPDNNNKKNSKKIVVMVGKF